MLFEACIPPHLPIYAVCNNQEMFWRLRMAVLGVPYLTSNGIDNTDDIVKWKLHLSMFMTGRFVTNAVMTQLKGIPSWQKLRQLIMAHDGITHLGGYNWPYFQQSTYDYFMKLVPVYRREKVKVTKELYEWLYKRGWIGTSGDATFNSRGEVIGQ
jgi:hypothetical protein